MHTWPSRQCVREGRDSSRTCAVGAFVYGPGGREKQAMIVRCMLHDVPPCPPDEPEWRLLDLAVGKEYRVIAIEYGDYRLMGESGRPYLYPSSAFEVVDDTWDDDWTAEDESDGCVSIGPPTLLAPGLFEDYFDGGRAARATVDELLRGKGFAI